MRPFAVITPARRVRALLAIRGMTQADLAREIGVSQSAVSRFLMGEGCPKWLERVAGVLGVDQRAINFGTNWPNMT